MYNCMTIPRNFVLQIKRKVVVKLFLQSICSQRYIQVTILITLIDNTTLDDFFKIATKIKIDANILSKIKKN